MLDTNEAAWCRHCGTEAGFTTHGEYELTRPVEVVFESEGGRHEMVPTSFRYVLLECVACHEPTLLRFVDYDYETELYPAAARIYDQLPRDVQRAYKEMLKVQRYSAPACAAMAGRVLEMMCKDQGAKGRLVTMLQDLAKAGKLHQQLADMADSLREFRNWGLHDEGAGVEVTDVPTILVFVDAILENVYVVQAKIAAVQAQVAQKKSNAIDGSAPLPAD